MTDVVILAGARTPTGKFGGCFKGLTAPFLGGVAIKGALKRANLSHSDTIDEVLMGCVLTAGQGQAPARQAAIKAGLRHSVPATTVNKMCGSGMEALMLANNAIRAGNADLLVAGGMESMTHAPYLSLHTRFGHRLGDTALVDHMMRDGLEDAYNRGTSMGLFAEACAKEHHFGRETLDEFATHSLLRAKEAAEKGLFEKEIEPVFVMQHGKRTVVSLDENPQTADASKISALPPAFKPDGCITAGNASSISDGAAALVLTSDAHAKKHKLLPLAKIIAQHTHAQAPDHFTTAPVGAIAGVLKKAKWNVNEVDLFEINEAFAVVTLYAMRELKLPLTKVNVHGGACALGHPIGASGARILVTLLNALEQRSLKKGIACLCLGGGEAVAMAIERH